MRYAFRLIGFTVTFFPSLLACGWFGGWFPRDPKSIGLFTVLFIIILILFYIGYSIYFKKTAGSYERALKNYREKQNQDKG